MPLYEYECDACHHRFERIQKYSDPLVDVCPSCGGAVKKLLSSPAFQFKGSGFYKTDYPTKTSTEAGSSKASRTSSSSDSSDSSSSPASATAPATSTSDSGKTDSTKSDAVKSDSGKKD
ncbi:MAG TPA: zinc ribbon domain-containing protein [Vicinamibacterales bacterium]|nr:zinc ribbon domain-containing protein [Vicinamibacterales bacterium]